MNFFKYLAIAAFASILAVACGKDDKGGSTLPKKQFYEDAKTYQISNPEDLMGFDQIDFFADGTGVARRDKNSIKPAAVRKYVPTYEYVPFTYTVKNGVYTITGLFAGGDDEIQFTLSYDAQTGNITIVIPDSDNPIVVEDVVVAEDLEIDNLADLCRKWKVKSIDIHVSGGDLSGTISGGQIFKHGDLYQIAKAIKSKGVNFDAEQLQGYEIKSIHFGKSGSIFVQFTGKDPYMGEYNIEGGAFSYRLNYHEGNNILSAEANGTISISGRECELKLNGSIDGESYDYESTIDIILIPA